MTQSDADNKYEISAGVDAPTSPSPQPPRLRAPRRPLLLIIFRLVAVTARRPSRYFGGVLRFVISGPFNSFNSFAARQTAHHNAASSCLPRAWPNGAEADVERHLPHRRQHSTCTCGSPKLAPRRARRSANTAPKGSTEITAAPSTRALQPQAPVSSYDAAPPSRRSAAPHVALRVPHGAVAPPKTANF